MCKDKDGSLWVGLCQRGVNLGCTAACRQACLSFKCPCHGSHYNVAGECLDGPATRSADRFALSFSGGHVVVSTGTLNNTVGHPDTTTRIIAPPTVPCSA